MRLEPTDLEMFAPIIERTLKNYFDKKNKNDFEKKIFNITQTKEILGKTYNWVADRIKDGTLKTTIDGKHVTGKEINRYLGENE